MSEVSTNENLLDAFENAACLLEEAGRRTKVNAQAERDTTRAAVLSRMSQGWQPIETAPTNESILIYLPNWDHYGPGIYRAILVDMGTGRRWHCTAWAIGRDLPHDCQPTHWRPLPDPPASESQP